MKNCVILVTAILLCGCSRPADNGIPENESPHRRAWELRRQGAPAEEFIGMQQKAVEQLREGKSTDDPVEVLAQMGYFYNNIGDYRNGLEYLQQAARAERGSSCPTEGAIQLYGNLGDLYVTLGMGEEALEMNTRGIEISRRLNGRMLSDLYRMRALVFDLLGQPDSVMASFDLAIKAIEEGDTRADKEELRAGVELERADYIVESGLWPDSIPGAVALMEQLTDSTGWDNSGEIFSLGRGYMALGDTVRGIRLMEEGLDGFRRQHDTGGIAYCLPPLMDAYAAAGRDHDLAANFKEYRALRDTLLSQEKAHALINADARFNNNMLTMDIEMHRQRVWFISSIALLVLVASGVWIYRSGRRHRLRAEESRREIDMLLRSRKELNERIRQLKAELEQPVDGAPPQLETTLLNRDDETVFRKNFSVLHPRFLPTLRQTFPSLSGGQELVCMLIHLRLNNDEIASSLGISRESVLKSRYRIRQRMQLPKETDLDTFLATLTSRKPHS